MLRSRVFWFFVLLFHIIAAASLKHQLGSLIKTADSELSDFLNKGVERLSDPEIRENKKSGSLIYIAKAQAALLIFKDLLEDQQPGQLSYLIDEAINGLYFMIPFGFVNRFEALYAHVKADTSGRYGPLATLVDIKQLLKQGNCEVVAEDKEKAFLQFTYVIQLATEVLTLESRSSFMFRIYVKYNLTRLIYDLYYKRPTKEPQTIAKILIKSALFKSSMVSEEISRKVEAIRMAPTKDDAGSSQNEFQMETKSSNEDFQETPKKGYVKVGVSTPFNFTVDGQIFEKEVVKAPRKKYVRGEAFRKTANSSGDNSSGIKKEEYKFPLDDDIFGEETIKWLEKIKLSKKAEKEVEKFDVSQPVSKKADEVEEFGVSQSVSKNAEEVKSPIEKFGVTQSVSTKVEDVKPPIEEFKATQFDFIRVMIMTAFYEYRKNVLNSISDAEIQSGSKDEFVFALNDVSTLIDWLAKPLRNDEPASSIHLLINRCLGNFTVLLPKFKVSLDIIISRQAPRDEIKSVRERVDQSVLLEKALDRFLDLKSYVGRTKGWEVRDPTDEEKDLIYIVRKVGMGILATHRNEPERWRNYGSRLWCDIMRGLYVKECFCDFKLVAECLSDDDMERYESIIPSTVKIFGFERRNVVGKFLRGLNTLSAMASLEEKKELERKKTISRDDESKKRLKEMLAKRSLTKSSDVKDDSSADQYEEKEKKSSLNATILEREESEKQRERQRRQQKKRRNKANRKANEKQNKRSADQDSDEEASMRVPSEEKPSTYVAAPNDPNWQPSQIWKHYATVFKAEHCRLYHLIPLRDHIIANLPEFQFTSWEEMSHLPNFDQYLKDFDRKTIMDCIRIVTERNIMIHTGILTKYLYDAADIAHFTGISLITIKEALKYNEVTTMPPPRPKLEFSSEVLSEQNCKRSIYILALCYLIQTKVPHDLAANFSEITKMRNSVAHPSVAKEESIMVLIDEYLKI